MHRITLPRTSCFLSTTASTPLFLALSTWQALALKSMTGAGRSSLFGASFASSSCCVRGRWRRYRRSGTWTTGRTYGYVLVNRRSRICRSAATYLVVILPVFMLTESSTITRHITTAARFICFPATVPATLEITKLCYTTNAQICMRPLTHSSNNTHYLYEIICSKIFGQGNR